ncbi:MAG: DUF1580 domain-containing protein [Planctomycetaceae bacterium]
MAATLAKRFKDALPLSQVSPFIPGRPHKATIWGWATLGVRGVRLATVIIGGRRMVTMEALEEFLVRLNADSPPVESQSDVARRAKEASAALERLGC